MTGPSASGARLPMTILLDAVDDYRVTRAVLGLLDRAGGVLVVDPTVGTTAVVSLAQDILVALGKQPAAVVISRIGTAALWQAATAWLAAAGIKRLVVLRAHRLPQRALARLAQLAADAPVALTVVWHAPPPPSWETVLPTATICLSRQVMEAVAVARRQGPGAAPPVTGERCEQKDQAIAHALTHALPSLPGSEAPWFRADAQRLLEREDFCRVDVLYGYGGDAVCAFASAVGGQFDRPLAACCRQFRARDEDRLAEANPASRAMVRAPGLGMAPSWDLLRARWAALRSPPGSAALPQVQECDRRSLVRFLVGLVVGMPSRAHSLAVLRGAQAGFLRHGLHLLLPAGPERWSGPGFTDPPFTSAVAEQIRSRIVDPVRAGAVAALLATGMPPALLGWTRLSDLAPDAATLSSQLPFRIDYPVPEWGRDLLAAARVYAAARHPGDGLLLLYLTCAKFVTTPDYAPRLRARLEVEQQLIQDADERGWAREVERHTAVARRLEALLADLKQGPHPEDASAACRQR
ncbi:hypothetical protein [Nonomuraea sp. NPDC049709]|uniref:hypothetical protein n=1 Tax=Nonomuraea sp. NPDC049709 TaxID=3154736 RepID=UPI00344312C9